MDQWVWGGQGSRGDSSPGSWAKGGEKEGGLTGFQLCSPTPHPHALGLSLLRTCIATDNIFLLINRFGWKDPLKEEKANPLQYSCLENPTDRGAWWATVHGVTESQT